MLETHLPREGPGRFHMKSLRLLRNIVKNPLKRVRSRMDQEELRLLRENNAMLKEILSYVRIVSSPRYVNNEQSREFLFNLIADLMVEKR